MLEKPWDPIGRRREEVGERGVVAREEERRENHESKPLIRVVAGSVGPTE